MSAGQLVLSIYGCGTVASFLLLAIISRGGVITVEHKRTVASGALACLLVALAWPAIAFVLLLFAAATFVFWVLDS